MELETNQDNHHRYMELKVFRLLLVCLFVSSVICHAQIKSDTELLIIAHKSFDRWRSAQSEESRIQVMREEMAGLSDAERTRAIALRIFDLDATEYGLKRYNAPSYAVRVLKEDPSFINDPKELKHLISQETDARRFFILATMANQLISSHNFDFVVEMAPMLFRSEPLANMPGEYQVDSLNNASWFTYALIVKNLKALNADFVPPDENLPYPEKIPILVKWLRNNWPGCEALSDKTKLSGGGISALQQKMRTNDASADLASNQDSSSNALWWKVLGASIVLLVVLAFWMCYRSTKSSLF